MMHNEADNRLFGDRLAKGLGLFLGRNGKEDGEIKLIIDEKRRALIKAAVYFAAAFGAGGAIAMGALMPFGLSVVCGCDSYLALVTVGACLGALVKGHVILPAIYSFALFVRLAVRKWTAANEDIKIRTLISGVSMAFYSVLSFAFGGSGAGDIAIRLVDIGACVLCTWCFSCIFGMERAYTPSYETGIFLAVYGIGCSLAGVTVFSLSPGYIIGFIVTVFIAFSGGALRGCAAGVLFGMGVNVLYAPSFAISGLIAGRLRKNPMIAVGASAVGCMIYASFTEGAYAVRYFLPDIAFASVLYAPLHKFGVAGSIDIFGASQGESALEEAAREAEKNRVTADRLSAVSGALHTLSSIFYGMSERMSESPSYDAARDMTKTFASDYESVAGLIKNAVSASDDVRDDGLEKKIRAALAVSGVRCRYIFVSGTTRRTVSVCGISPAFAQKRADALMRRIGNISAMRFSAPEFTYDDGGCTMVLRSLPTYSCEYSNAQSAKRGEKISGDSLCCFYDTDGNFYALLCDGMGSGRDAAVAARICCVFIEKMLEGGNDPSLTLDMLNTFLRGKGYECFATVDMLKIDLYSGRAYFIKGGGAPSYIVRGGSSYRITSASCPVGIISEVHAEKITFSVEDGDTVIMCSDGADDGEENQSECIRTITGDCAEVAQKVLAHAQRKYSYRDDASVICVKIKRESQG